MNCNDARRLCCGHLDRDLTYEQEAALREHVAVCPECAEQLGQLQGCVELLRSLPQVDPGPSFYEGVRARIRAAECLPDAASGRVDFGACLRDRLGAWFLRPAAMAAAGLALGLVLGGGAMKVAMEPAQQGQGELAAAERSVEAVAPSDPGSGEVNEPASSISPLADLDLSRVGTSADSALQRSQPEYLLEPFVSDPRRGLVPVGMEYIRGVSADRETQSDVYVTF